MGDPSHDPVAEALDALNEDDQHDHDGPHDFRHEALVAVADAEVAETAAAHGAGHGGVADQADDRDRQACDDAGHGFGKQDLRDPAVSALPPARREPRRASSSRGPAPCPLRAGSSRRFGR